MEPYKIQANLHTTLDSEIKHPMKNCSQLSLNMSTDFRDIYSWIYRSIISKTFVMMSTLLKLSVVRLA